MKPVFFTAAYHSRNEKAAGEMNELERILCRRAGELRDCETSSLNLSAPGWEGELTKVLQRGQEVWIQPVLLFDGLGQNKLKALTRPFPHAVLGYPLITGEGDFEPLTAALEIPREKKTLLLGHGGETAAPVLRAFSAWLENRNTPAFAAALKGAPGWEEAAAWLNRRPTPGGEVLLVPLLLTAGVHLQRDTAACQARLADAGISACLRTEGLAGLSGIQEMYGKRVEELLK